MIKLRKRKGFTLVELMIVVAIIGILAAVAIPKFANLIRKAHEGATKGKLMTLRSAMSIYYADTEGTIPTTFANLESALLGSVAGSSVYLDETPTVRSGVSGATCDTETGLVETIANPTDRGAACAAGISYTTATYAVYMACGNSSHTDTKAEAISTW